MNAGLINGLADLMEWQRDAYAPGSSVSGWRYGGRYK